MAREVIIRMTDDFDRTKIADEPIEFEFEGVRYVIDLTAEHADEFRAAMQPYMDHAHEKVKPRRSSGGTTQKSPEGETTKDRAKIRKWAKKQGMKVPARGILSREIRAAYAAAEGGPAVQGPLTLDAPDDPPAEPTARQTAAPNRLPEGVPNSQGITTEMRDWARANGHPVKRGGYLTAEVRKLFEADQMFSKLNGSTAEREPARNGQEVNA